jgi:hypothetical protein
MRAALSLAVVAAAPILGSLALAGTGAQPAAVHAWTVYDASPEHPWNRLFRALFLRTGRDGVEYGRDALDPLLFEETIHFLAGDAHRRVIGALDAFAARHAETLIADPVKRASMQRDLWAVFDWTTYYPERHHQTERRELQRRLAPLIRALALTREQIAALPPERALTGALFTPGGDAVLAGRDDGPMGKIHTQAFPFFGRSAFLVFIRAPGGRSATLNLIRQLNARPGPDLPEGTEVFLVRRAILIDRDGQVALSPLVESRQRRRFDARGNQTFAEAILDRDRLFHRPAEALRELTAADQEFMLFSSHGMDPFEFRPEEGFHGPSNPLQLCPACHVMMGDQRGAKSLLSFARGRFPSAPGERAAVHETTIDREAAQAIAFKTGHESWKTLQKYWR